MSNVQRPIVVTELQTEPDHNGRSKHRHWTLDFGHWTSYEISLFSNTMNRNKTNSTAATNTKRKLGS